MKSTATKTAKTRLNVPQILGLKRVSTDAQDTARQTADLARLEREYKVQVAKVLEIEGLSGTATIRDADIKNLLAELADAHIAGLGTSSINRLGRAVDGDAFTIINPFIRAHKPIYSVREGIVEPWTERGFATAIKALLDGGSELREMRRLSMDQKLAYAEQGIITSSHAPYGYRYISKRRAGKWVIFVPKAGEIDEAKIVREMFRRAALLKWTGADIATWLNEDAKIPAAKGGLWSSCVVRAILYNPVYVGRARFGKGTDHERVIAVDPVLVGDEALWYDMVQVQKTKNQAEESGRRSRYYLLQKLIYCGALLEDGSICGHRMNGFRKKKSGGGEERYYKCSERNRHDWTRQCSAGATKMERLDNAIYGGLIGNLSDAEALEKLLDAEEQKRRKARPSGPSPADRIAKLKRDAAALDRKLGDGDLMDSWDATKKQLLAVKSEISVLEREAARNADVLVMPSRQSIASFARDLRDAGEVTDTAARRELVKQFIVRITYADGEAVVQGRFPVAQKSIKSGGQNSYNPLEDATSFAPFVFRVKVA